MHTWNSLHYATGAPKDTEPLRNQSSPASRLNLATVFLPIPFTRSKSSQSLKGLLPPLTSRILAAITGPMPGSNASDSGGAVEKKTRGSERNRGGSSCDTDAVFSTGKTCTTGISCRSMGRRVRASSTTLRTKPGSAIKQNNNQAPTARRIPSPTSALVENLPGETEHQRSRCHQIAGDRLVLFVEHVHQR